MKHNPWLKFWPQDWLTDIELRSCSSAQRGTLIDLMCVAHRSENYGVILSDDTPVARKMLAKCLSLTERTLNNHLTSLLQMSRICRTDDGQLFIKRMVQDHHKSLTNSDNGKKGGNPSLKPEVKAEENREEKKREEKVAPEGAMSLACSLLDSIVEWKPDFNRPTKAKLNSWALDIDKAIRLDKRTHEGIADVIKWLPTHEGSNGFTWRAQILSGRKLRAQFDQLGIAFAKDGPPPDRHPTKANCDKHGNPIFRN